MEYILIDIALYYIFILNYFFKKNKILLKILCFIFFIFLSGFRYESGPDFSSYFNFYNNPGLFKNFEIGFRCIVEFFNKIGINYY